MSSLLKSVGYALVCIKIRPKYKYLYCVTPSYTLFTCTFTASFSCAMPQCRNAAALVAPLSHGISKLR